MAVKIAGAPATIKCTATYVMYDANGAVQGFEFGCEFNRLNKTERNALVLGHQQGELTIDDVLDRVMVGWSGMTDEQGQPVPYSPAERRATEEAYPEISAAMAVSYFDHAIIHQRDQRDAAKNSKAQSGTTSGGTAPSASS